MRPTLLLLLLAACDRTPPTVDAGFTTGDDDDAVADTDPVETGTPCAEAGFAPAPTATGPALVAALHDLTSAQTCPDYGAATEWMFLVLDNEDDEVECVYTGRRTPVSGSKPDEADMNTEHSWPQSLGADDEPAKCDLHHLYPTDTDENALRGNWPFAEVSGGPGLGEDAGGDTAYEPRDEHKGNAARSMLYFAMRYDHGLSAAELGLYRAWSASDPADDAEIARSLRIGGRQGAANPYVVCPGLVEQL